MTIEKYVTQMYVSGMPLSDINPKPKVFERISWTSWSVQIVSLDQKLN